MCINLLVLFSFASSILAAPQGYGGGSSGGSQFGGGSARGYGSKCSGGQVRHIDGSCVQPKIQKNIFVYAAPEKKYNYGPPPFIPKPRINYNIVFVRTPEGPENQEPIIIPPTEQQTVVYVLSKNEKAEGAKVYEVPDTPRPPEVYYVNYNDGENPQLPGGIDLKAALASADSQQGEVFSKGGGFGGSSYN